MFKDYVKLIYADFLDNLLTYQDVTHKNASVSTIPQIIYLKPVRLQFCARADEYFCTKSRRHLGVNYDASRLEFGLPATCLATHASDDVPKVRPSVA